MISRFNLENVLAFQRLSLELRPLTLLSGTNSSGKSSLLHVLAVLRQSYTAHTLPGELLLNGLEAELGTGRDILHSDPLRLGDAGFAIRVGVQANGMEYDWLATYEAAADVLTATGGPAESPVIGLFEPGFQYLRADRIVPSVTYPKSHEAVVVQRSLGSRGEHAPNYLRVHGEEAIVCELAAHPDAASRSLLDQTNAWLNELSPGTSLAVEDVAGTDFVRLSFFRQGPDVKTESHRATNVGFGLTYVLPLIIACLMGSPESLLLVENPEAHLHPSGQGVVGRLCALSAASGAQVVVETHSDHVLNAVRLAVKRGEIPARDVIVHFFTRLAGVLQPGVETMEVSEDGMLPHWPPGFFDEWDSALNELLG